MKTTTIKSKSTRQHKTTCHRANEHDIANRDLAREFDGGVLNDDILDPDAMILMGDEEGDVIYY